MKKHSNVTPILRLLTIVILVLWYQTQASAQETQPGGSARQLALLAIAPPPENAGILTLYQIPARPEIPKVDVATPGYPLSASWSPDGSLLAVIMISGQPGGDVPPSDIDIYAIDRQGENLVKLTDTPNCPEIGLAWQADSSALYFTGFCRDSQETSFWRLDPHTNAAERLGEVQWDATWAVWSPDVSKVALLAPRRAEDGALYDELYVALPDGQMMTNLAKDIHPGYLLQQSTVLAWSPQSDWLVYVTKTEKTDQGAVNQVILVRPDGSERKVLVTSQPDQECLNPLWSPTSEWISFTCGGNLFAVHSDGIELKNLTSPSAGQAVEYPAWTQDGESLAFISLASDGKRQIESVNIDGTQRQVIAEILAVQTFGLAWNPVAQVISEPIATVTTSPGLTLDPTLTSEDVDQAVILTPVGSEPGQVLNLTPENLAGQGEVLDTNGQAGIDGSLAPEGRANDANNLSYLWLLVILLLGGSGVFFILRRAGKHPGLEKPERPRKLRREQRMQARSSESQVEENLSARPGELTSRDAETLEHPLLLQKGIDQIRSKDIQGGIATLHQYVDAAPGDSTAWLWLGWASALDNEYRTAERCFLHARRLGNPQADEALDWLAKSRK